MRVERRTELQRHLALATTAGGGDVVGSRGKTALHPASSRFSLLRMSVTVRLLMVFVAAGLLWLAVLWALQ